MGRKSREKRERRQAQQREVAVRRIAEERLLADAVERGCIFCREGDGGFDAVEHVFPESLGNKTLILPRGVVCDRCNNRTLSTLDQVLVTFMPVQLRITMLGVPSKAGRVKVLSLQGETYEHIHSATGGEPTLKVTSKTKGRHSLKETARHPDGRVELRMEGTGGRRFTPRYASELSRTLLKCALECAWIDHREGILEERFDHVRAAVLGRPWDGFIAVAKTSPNPNSYEVTLFYDVPRAENGWRMPVWLDVYGVVIHTDSRLAAPPPEVREEEWNLRGFTEADLPRNSVAKAAR